MSDVVVIGCGGVGLGLALALASKGVSVLGVDADPRRVEELSVGKSGLLDAGMDAALRAGLDAGMLSFGASARRSDAHRTWIIAVPTALADDLRLDERPLLAASDAIAAASRPGDLVIMRSTVPIGWTRRLSERLAGRDLHFAAAPDRSLAGQAFEDQISTPNVVGGLDPAALEKASALLGRVGEVTTVSSPEAAEALKLFTNTWRDARFALANQFAEICRGSGLDFEEIRRAGAVGFGRFDTPRAGPVGGPCLTKDAHLLAQSPTVPDGGADLLLAARRVNEALIGRVLESIRLHCARASGVVRIAVLGLAFKGRPPTLDQRGSAGSAIASGLAGAAAAGAVDLRCWDPAAAPGEGGSAVQGAGIVVLANDHPDLADPALAAACGPNAIVYDLCGVLEGVPRADLRVRRLSSAANW